MTDRSAGPPEESRASGNFSIGSRIAGYRLDERIGAGGMAVVFRAYDTRLDRNVALKVMAPSLSEDDAFRQRFIRESRAAAAVDDPHIIPVYEAGEADGVLFIAMRYVRGGDVRSLIDRAGRLPLDQVAEIISQAAEALDAAHARGLVHRDVKPANILLESSPATGRSDHVYLSDFGLTKTSVGTSLALTATGEFLGTLEYVSPEQIEGRPLDGRCDEYALACSAYEMLCGQPPFQRDQSMAVMFAHLSEPPPAIRRYRSELPREVEAVLGRALAKPASDRYPTCGEFAAALRAALQPRGSGGPAPVAGSAHPLVASRTDTQIAEPRAGVGAAAGPQPSSQPRGTPDHTAPAEPLTPASTEPAGYRQPALAGATDPSGLRGGSADSADAPAPRRSRPWWRGPAPVGALCVLALVAAAGGFLLASRGHPSRAAGAASPPPHSAAALTAPGCTTAIGPATALSGVATTATSSGSAPFGVVIEGDYSFVSGGGTVTVLRDAGTALTPVRTIAVPGANLGDVITHDGRYLLAAAGSGAVVIDIAAALNGGYPIVGSLTSPSGSGAAEVVTSPDDSYAFVTLQTSNELAVFNLRTALTDGFSSGAFVGYVPLGPGPVGLAASDDTLYVADEGGSELSVVRLSSAESDPAGAVTATVAAGCAPGRAVLSSDQKVLWVTARGSDALLAFSTAKLGTDPAHALIASVLVGEAPLGMTFAAGGARMVVADSNQENVKGQSSSLAVVDTASALAGKPALLGYLPTGVLPRNLAVEPDGSTLLVAVTNSHEVQAVDLRNLP